MDRPEQWRGTFGDAAGIDRSVATALNVAALPEPS
jgi:hypothetical protein